MFSVGKEAAQVAALATGQRLERFSFGTSAIAIA